MHFLLLFFMHNETMAFSWIVPLNLFSVFFFPAGLSMKRHHFVDLGSQTLSIVFFYFICHSNSSSFLFKFLLRLVDRQQHASRLFSFHAFVAELQPCAPTFSCFLSSISLSKYKRLAFTSSLLLMCFVCYILFMSLSPRRLQSSEIKSVSDVK